MSWADLLKSIVCVLNLIACVRLTGPYLIPKRSDREWSEARRRTDLYCRLAGWIGVFAYSYGLGHAHACTGRMDRHGIRRGSGSSCWSNPESRHLDVSARSLAWQEPVASSLCDINKGLCG